MKHTCMPKASGEPGETRQDYSGEYGVKMVNICVLPRSSHTLCGLPPADTTQQHQTQTHVKISVVASENSLQPNEPIASHPHAFGLGNGHGVVCAVASGEWLGGGSHRLHPFWELRTLYPPDRGVCQFLRLP